MADVFLSYSSKDRAAAERVQQALAARGIAVFWDQETPPGQDWDTWIRAKLSACRVAVVLWSHTSAKSPNVKHEAIVARDAGKFVPAMIDALTPSDFPMGLYLVQAVNLEDWRNPESKGMARLVAEVEARLGKHAAPAAPPPPRTPAASPAQGGGLNPLVMVVVALALIGGAGWWISQNQQPPPSDANRISGSQVFSPGGAQPEAACGDGSIPALGVCADGNRPIPPAPMLGPTPAESGQTFSRRILGHWRWRDNQPCAEGPNITFENGRLLFTTIGTPTAAATRFVHFIESDTDRETRTSVLEPDWALGNKYVLTQENSSTSGARNFNLVVVTAGEKNTWSPCEP